MQPLKSTSSALRGLVFHPKTRVAACLHTLHAHCSIGQPLFTRHHAASRISLSSIPPLSMFTPNHTEPDPPEKISDLEWEIRTGRAIYILEQTLPDFFQVGLVSSVDPTRPDIVDVPLSESSNTESIYSPTIRLTYTPPAALPPPFPATLSLEGEHADASGDPTHEHPSGLPLYMASSVFIRHTMKTLYTDLRVEMRKLVVHTPTATSPTKPPGATQSRRREKSVFIGVTVYGTTRVSGGLGEWQVDSTYGFSPVSGLINQHTINSIQPAPHRAAYDALRTSLSQVFGMGGGMQPGEVHVVERRDPR